MDINEIQVRKVLCLLLVRGFFANAGQMWSPQTVTLSKLKKYGDRQQNLSFLFLTRLTSPTRKDYNLPIFSRFVIDKNIWTWYISKNAYSI